MKNNKLINKKNNKRGLFFFSLLALTYVKDSVCHAADVGDPTKIGEALDILRPSIEENIKPISSILVFMAVVITGMTIILKRNKKDERSTAMMGLLTIAIGCFILGCAGIFYSFIMALGE